MYYIFFLFFKEKPTVNVNQDHKEHQDLQDHKDHLDHLDYVVNQVL